MYKVRVRFEDFTKGFFDILMKSMSEDVHFLEFNMIEDEDGLTFMSVDTIDGDGGTTDMFTLDDIDVNYTYKFTKEYKRIKEFEELLATKAFGENEDEDFWDRKHKCFEEMKNEFFNNIAINNKDNKNK